MNDLPHLYLIRGLPGSGKSTLARKMSEAMGLKHFEADMFMPKSGFDPSYLSSAHEGCFGNTVHALHEGYSVVVSNTFVKIWEMMRYLNLPYPHTVITCEGEYGSIHNVPEQTVAKMRAEWEKYK